MSRRWYPLVVAAAVAGCVSQRDAQSALEQAQKDITDAHTYIMRYVPSAFDTIMAEYRAAKTSLDSGRYREAQRRAEAASALASAGERAATREKQSMERAFVVVRDSLPPLLAAIEAQLDAFAASGRPPRDGDRLPLDSARAALAELHDGWQRAARAYDRGDLRDAVHAATALLQRADRLGVAVGMKAS